MNKAIVLIFVILISGCERKTNTEIVKNDSSTSDESFSNQIEKTYKKSVFDKQGYVHFTFLLAFGGVERFNGTVVSDVFSNKAELLSQTGDSIFVDRQEVFYNEAYANPKGVRFQAYTWTYFFLLPYKLNDPGTKWEDFTPEYELPEGWVAKKLYFEQGVGDTAEDWYIVFVNKDKQIEYVSYIVTAGKNKEEAEREPHAIVYKNYKNIAGIPIATEWEFRNWNSKEGLGEQLGNAKILDVTFKNEHTFISHKNFKKS